VADTELSIEVDKLYHIKLLNRSRAARPAFFSISGYAIKLRGYLQSSSCIGCGSGFQPRSFNVAAESRSHRGFLW